MGLVRWGLGLFLGSGLRPYRGGGGGWMEEKDVAPVAAGGGRMVRSERGDRE